MILTEPFQAEQGRMQQPTNQQNTMQNYCKTIGALAAASALAAGNATAIEIDYELGTGYTSEYIWRGINLGQDLVEVGLDASTEINGIGLSAGAWYGSFTTGSVSGDELDLYTEASYDFGFLTAAVGYIFYHFPNTDPNPDDAQEIYFSLGRDFGIVDVSLTHFWGIETDNDGYTELAATNSTELSSCLTLVSGLALGYLVEEGDFTHLTAKVALDYALTETATVSPFIAHSWSLSEGGRQHSGSSDYIEAKNQLFGGVKLAVSF
jgi:hypothetical protein